jgi:hypothetical protein
MVLRCGNGRKGPETDVSNRSKATRYSITSLWEWKAQPLGIAHRVQCRAQRA